MENKNNKSSLPFTIIGLALVGAIGLGFYFYSSAGSSQKNASNKKSPSNTSKSNYSSASPGANPPNVLGPSNALITLEEFADFQCGMCASTHPKIKEIKNAYGDRLRFVFRNFPLAIPAHDKAYDAAVAVEAAGAQGKFWDMQNLLFTNQQAWSTSPDYKKTFEEYAQRIGLNLNKYKDDIISLAIKSRVDADLKRGRELSLTSTPSIFINGRALTAAEIDVQKMREIIDAELQRMVPTTANANSANTK